MSSNPATPDRNTIVTTHSGVRINLKNPDVSEVSIEDIAHTLSHICRWVGIPEDYFSVAEHSVMAAELAPPEHRLALLMHDCEESILGDNITPLKNMVPELVILGNTIRELLLQKFKIPYDEAIVKIYDRKQLEWERYNIVDNALYAGLPPKKAKALFIKKFKEYSSYIK
jgi:hypothetical protein